MFYSGLCPGKFVSTQEVLYPPSPPPKNKIIFNLNDVLVKKSYAQKAHLDFCDYDQKPRFKFLMASTNCKDSRDIWYFVGARGGGGPGMPAQHANWESWLEMNRKFVCLHPFKLNSWRCCALTFSADIHLTTLFGHICRCRRIQNLIKLHVQ